MAPGVQVAQITANTWAISIRGFNAEFANELLVMVDGRSIYNSFYGGVFWDMHDVMLQDVERIEIIRGPGGTLWGANAVNGIINIITKNAADTQGGLLTGGGGSEEQGFGAFRYGGKIDENTFFRIYSKYFNRDDSRELHTNERSDEWSVQQGGFRIDSKTSQNDDLTLQGDVFKGRIGQSSYAGSLTLPFYTTFNEEVRISGGNILGRWHHTFSDSSDMILQSYYDRSDRREALFHETTNTFDFDFQHGFRLADRHHIVWGLGYRFVTDEVNGSLTISLDPQVRDMHLYSSFLQDEITLVEDKLKLILGTKFEYNEFTGFEYQPSGRLLWTPDENQTFWASVSRAVRTPSRYDRDATLWMGAIPGSIPPDFDPIVMRLLGDGEFHSEQVIAYELGYRVRPTRELVVDFAAFFNTYDDLASLQLGQFSTGPDYLVMPFVLDNKLDGETYGAELYAAWNVTEKWRLKAGYTFLQMQLHADNASSDTTTAPKQEGESPHNQFHVGSYLDLPGNLELDVSLNYVDNLGSTGIPHYLRCDARLGWHITENLEFSLVGQELFDSRHPETISTRGRTLPMESQRRVFAQLTLRF